MLKMGRTTDGFCELPFKRMKITCDGYVTMCCYQKRKCLGNILEKSFDDIWFGELAQKIRSETEKNRLHKTCQVSGCPFLNTNLIGKKILYNSYPISFEIDLPSQHCNIGGLTPNSSNPACIMCERHTNFIHQEDRLNEVCEKISPYVKYVESIHIQGVSEPFWKNRIFEIIDLLKIEKNSHIRISTTTNGTLMNQDHRKMFLEFPLSSITWSLDACTPETYVKIRRVDMYDKIIENLMAYSQERTPDQILRIHNNINLLNVHEVEGMMEIAAKANVDVIDFNPTCSIPVICVDKDNVKVFRKAQIKIIELAEKLNINTTFTRNLTLHYDDTDWDSVRASANVEKTSVV